MDRTLDLIDVCKRSDSSRMRKHSVNLHRGGTLEELHNNIGMAIDEKLTNKLLFMKKLEKLEKEAIRHFYDNKV